MNNSTSPARIAGRTIPAIFLLLLLYTPLQSRQVNLRGLQTLGTVEELKLRPSASSMISCDCDGDSMDDLLIIGRRDLEFLIQRPDPYRFVRKTVTFKNEIRLCRYSRLGRDKVPILMLLWSEGGEYSIYDASKVSRKKALWRSKLPGLSDGIILGDLDGDRRTDIIAYGMKRLGISYLRGNGDGTFSRPRDIFPEYSFNTALLSNLHGDPYPDFIGSSWLTDQIMVFTNNGKMKFSEPLAIEAANYPTAIMAKDFNDDLNIDLLAFSEKSGEASFFKGEIGGGFSAGENRRISDRPVIVGGADFNNDGVGDLVIANPGSKSLTVIRLDRNGGFAASVPFFGSDSITAMALYRNYGSQFTNVALLDAGRNLLRIFYSPEAGQRALKGSSYGIGAGPWKLSAADLNGDGWKDVILSNRRSGTLSLFINQGGRSLGGQISYSLPGHPSYIQTQRSDSGFTVVAADDGGKVILSRVNLSDYSQNIATFTAQRRITLVKDLSVREKNPFRIFTLQTDAKTGRQTIVSYLQTQREKFAEKIVEFNPRGVIRDLLLLDDGRSMLLALGREEQRKTEIVKASKVDDGLTKLKTLFTLDDPLGSELELFCGRINHDDQEDIAIKLGEPENKVYIFYASREKGSELTVYRNIDQIPDASFTNMQFHDLGGSGDKEVVCISDNTGSVEIRSPGGKLLRRLGYPAVGGMITDYAVADMDNDGMNEIVLTDMREGLLKILSLKVE